MLAEVGLDAEALDRYPSELSGGQRRLVLLAMALVCDPSVVVLDEPTAGLDPSTRARVVDTLRRLRDERRVALVILGHDVEAIEAVADRVAVLYRGWLAEVGPARRVLDEPRAPYTWALLNARPTLGSVKDLRGIRGRPARPHRGRGRVPVRGPLHPGRRPVRGRAGRRWWRRRARTASGWWRACGAGS